MGVAFRCRSQGTLHAGIEWQFATIPVFKSTGALCHIDRLVSEILRLVLRIDRRVYRPDRLAEGCVADTPRGLSRLPLGI